MIPDAGIQILFAERARDVDRGPHLVEIPSTALARLEVSVEPLSIGFRKRAVQIVTDDLNQFLAGQFASIRSHYLRPFQIPFQLPSHLRARPVQQDPLMGLRDRQDVTDLRGRESFDVTHGDDNSLIRGQGIDRLLHEGAGLMGEEPLLRRLVPVLRKAHPVPDPLVTGREEPVRRDRGLAVVGIVLRRERGKGQRPRLALATTLGLVGQDAEEPGAERGSLFEAIDTLEDAVQVSWATSSATAWLATKRLASRTSRA